MLKQELRKISTFYVAKENELEVGALVPQCISSLFLSFLENVKVHRMSALIRTPMWLHRCGAGVAAFL